MAAEALDHIFAELRHHEEQARSGEETRDSRLATLVALSGAVLGLLVASLPDGRPGVAEVVTFLPACLLFTLAILVATQFALSVPLLSHHLGGSAEDVPEVDLEELAAYLTPGFQDSEKSLLQERVLPAMYAGIGARRRNAVRKEKCLKLTIQLIASGIFATAVYAGILVL